jgi:hypothetical protein
MHSDVARVKPPKPEKHPANIVKHPMFFGVPELAKRVTDYTNASPCKCSERTSFEHHPIDRRFHSWPFAWPRKRMCTADIASYLRRRYDNPLHPDGTPYRTKELAELFTSDEHKMLHDRLHIRYMEWSKKHELQNSRGSTGESIEAHFHKIAAAHYEPGSDGHKAHIAAQWEHYSAECRNTTRNAMNTILGLEFCNCPGFVPLTQREVLLSMYRKLSIPMHYLDDLDKQPVVS